MVFALLNRMGSLEEMLNTRQTIDVIPQKL
jgi:hypothetical protein